VDLSLVPAQLELQARARSYLVDHLQPLEAELEQAGGRLPAATRGEPLISGPDGTAAVDGLVVQALR
jgi:hypothetical protein